MRALNQLNLHRITGEEIFVVNEQKNGGVRFVKLNDDKAIEYSQSALFRRIKSKEELLCGRLTVVVQLQLTEDQKKLQNLQKTIRDTIWSRPTCGK